MFELLPIMGISILLAYISGSRSKYDHTLERYVSKESTIWFFMSVLMILFVGLRYHYNDTAGYRIAYSAYDASTSVFKGIVWSPARFPGFMLVNHLLAKLGFSEQSFLMTYAIITVGIYLWFLRKYTNNLPLTIFLFLTMGVYTFCLAAIKQTVAVAFCLLATDRAIQKKYGPFVFWIAVAMLFHAYSFMYLIVPFLMFKPWSRKTWVLLSLFGVAGVSLQFLIGRVVDVTTMLGAEYDIAALSGEGVNIFRVLVVWAPVFLSLMVRNKIEQSEDPINNLMFNLTMLNAEIMFVGLFGTANYFGRLANYFLIFQCIAIPWVLSFFPRRERNTYMTITVVGFILYAIYAYAINDKFDYFFSSVSLFDYIRSLFTHVQPVP